MCTHIGAYSILRGHLKLRKTRNIDFYKMVKIRVFGKYSIFTSRRYVGVGCLKNTKNRLKNSKHESTTIIKTSTY